MPKPTINQLLDWFDRDIDAGCAEHSMIRAILEQHRNLRPVPIGALLALRENHKLEAIRAFVERVEKRAHEIAKPHYWCEAFVKAMGEELAAMEADNVL